MSGIPVADSGTWVALDSLPDARAVARERRAAKLDAGCERVETAALRAEIAIAAGRIHTPASSPRTAVLRPRVLLVEDHLEVARVAMRAFEAAGIRCAIAWSATEALGRLGEAWDAIVCDLHLGAGATGVSVLREAALQCPSARRIVWSGALGPAELEEAARASGAHQALSKAAAVSVLIAAVRGVEVCRGT